MTRLSVCKGTDTGVGTRWSAAVRALRWGLKNLPTRRVTLHAHATRGVVVVLVVVLTARTLIVCKTERGNANVVVSPR